MEAWEISNILIPLAGKLIDRRSGSQSNSATSERIEKLEREVEQLQGEHASQLEEIHERLDFAERILSNPEKQ